MSFLYGTCGQCTFYWTSFKFLYFFSYTYTYSCVWVFCIFYMFIGISYCYRQSNILPYQLILPKRCTDIPADDIAIFCISSLIPRTYVQGILRRKYNLLWAETRHKPIQPKFYLLIFISLIIFSLSPHTGMGAELWLRCDLHDSNIPCDISH